MSDVIVKEMYNLTKSKGTPLLSNYSGTFWREYINDYTKYDNYFSRRYNSFRYFLQGVDENINEVTENFTTAVYEHLLMNDKKYSELYRVQILDDAEYSLLDNYNVHETITREGTSNGSIVSGQRQDTQSMTDKSSPFDSENFYNDKANESSSIKGEETDTTENGYNETTTTNKNGNIGVQTGSDMLVKHTDYWKSFNFYDYIFSEISKELLLV